MSPPPRLFVESDLAANARVTLTADQARYLNQVLRKKPGDPVRLFNGRDGEWATEIAAFGKHEGTLLCRERTRAQRGVPDLHLLFAPVKRARTDFIVEKATELGVALIRPVFTARTNSETVRTDRLRAIAIEAAEQTERLEIPVIGEPAALQKTLENWDPERRLLFADEAGAETASPWGGETVRAAPIAQILRDAPHGPWAILIGPEGGFTREERDALRNLAYVTPSSLGPRILRADTAALAALTIWQANLGDWD
jgi:16S rRNA (uracil1498-N3)-methyltransferase